MSRRPSHTSNHTFSEVPSVQIPRSSFNRSHTIKTTFDSGDLVPILVDEALPGDTFRVKLTAFSRMATPIYPIMDNLFMDVFFFSIPNRLVWDNWQKFCGEQIDPGDSIDYTIPVISSSQTAFALPNSIYDYMGLPTNETGVFTETSSLPLRAYNLCYNEWFRDQNLQDSLEVVKGDGPDTPGSVGSFYTLKKRGKRHDYFTSALPWPQKGDSVDLPLGQYAPVIGDGTRPTMETSGGGAQGDLIKGADGSLDFSTTSNPGYSYWRNSGLQADLSDATAATINQLRQAFQVQKLLERDARGGTRYVEIIKAHFGVTTPSAGWRSEYLGGGT
jgi:hypothetical protein